MINVVHISTFHREGGAAIAALRLNHALAKLGVKSDMLVHQSDKEEEGVTPFAQTNLEKKWRWLRFVGERLAYLPHEKDKTVRFAFSPALIGTDISQHPLIQTADIIHLHWFNFGFLSLNGMKKLFELNKPIVWTLHDMWAFTGGCHYSRGCERFTTHCSDCPYLSDPGKYDLSFSQFEFKRKLYGTTPLTFITPSKWLGQLVQTSMLSQSKRCEVIPNCIDTSQFIPLDKRQVRIQLGLPDTQKYLLFSGANTADPRKGFRFLKEAIQQIKRRDLSLLIFGKGSQEDFHDLDLPVHFLGKISSVATMVQAYNAADLIVVPSLEDNLPNTIMEGMSCGTPTVGFNTGGISDMIDHLQNGYLATSRSAKDLALGIEAVLDGNVTGIMGQNARKKVVENYAENHIAGQHLNLYQTLL